MNQRITEGQPVYDADGNELGTVKEVQGSYFKVDAPMAKDYWLRTDALSATGADGGIVVTAGAQQYSEPGSDMEAETRTTTTNTTTTRDRDAATTGYATERAGTYDRDRVDRTDRDESLELREERLRVGKEREQAGEVHLGKRVEEHTEQVNVPLREERVVIERHPGTGRAVDGEITDTNEEIDVPLTKERARVDKEAVVREEVSARKEAVDRTERVQDTVRREELVVEGDGDVTTDRENLNAPRTTEYDRERTRRG